MKNLFRTVVVLCSLMAGLMAFVPAAHAESNTIKPLYTTTVNGMKVRVYSLAAVENQPGVTKSTILPSIGGPTPDVLFNENGGAGYILSGHIYAAEFVQNGHVLCAWGAGDASTQGPTGTTSLSLAVTLFYGGQELNGWSDQVTNGITFISGDTLCVGAGDGVYTAFAYGIAYWVVPNLQLGGGSHASI